MVADTSQREEGAFAKRQFFLPRQPGKSKSFLNTNRPKGSTIGAENKRTVWTEKVKKRKKITKSRKVGT